ncbi:hypothetical protein LPJ64_004238 [Coemansia asiatica]|uniref:Uncharacterized protein n=1 Tax=Coemansia asiatica TaxID=1052880 RepID=A0A9W8CJ87_9FUNG|nr:hypothetical protein LPJ64_004238 [Coemansia asiatica]
MSTTAEQTKVTEATPAPAVEAAAAAPAVEATTEAPKAEEKAAEVAAEEPKAAEADKPAEEEAKADEPKAEDKADEADKPADEAAKTEESALNKLKRRSTVVKTKAGGVLSRIKKLLTRTAKETKEEAKTEEQPKADEEAKPEEVAAEEPKAEESKDSAVVAEAAKTEEAAAPKAVEATPATNAGLQVFPPYAAVLGKAHLICVLWLPRSNLLERRLQVRLVCNQDHLLHNPNGLFSENRMVHLALLLCDNTVPRRVQLVPKEYK